MIFPFMNKENGELVIRGMNIVWFTLFVQSTCIVAFSAVAVKQYIIDRRRKATRITLTMSNGGMSGEYEKVL